MNILNKRINKNSEKYVQNLVINNKKVQKYIIDNLGLQFTGREKFTKGKSYINRIYHLDRGYERLEKKLKNCNANISRLN